MERHMQPSFEAEEPKTRETACRFISLLLAQKYERESPNKLDSVFAEANKLFAEDEDDAA